MTKSYVALIPAHNEEATVERTFNSLYNQSVKFDRIIVVADNCTDRTVEIALSIGAEVFESVNNKHKKAGALNQAIASVIDTMDDDDILAVVDADSDVGSNFVFESMSAFASNSKLGGVSGSYVGREGGKLAGWFQRNEIARWCFDDKQANGKTVILSGASSAFPAKSIRALLDLRGFVYDHDSITEDFELSMALLHNGWEIKKMLKVQVSTAVKPDFRSLHIQRIRWDRGINDALIKYGMTRHTAMVWVRRSIYALQCLATVLSLAFLLVNIFYWHSFSMHWFWIVLGLIIATEKALTVRSRGWKNIVAAGVLIPEMPYDIFLMTSFVKSIAHSALNKQTVWR